MDVHVHRNTTIVSTNLPSMRAGLWRGWGRHLFLFCLLWPHPPGRGPPQPGSTLKRVWAAVEKRKQKHSSGGLFQGSLKDTCMYMHEREENANANVRIQVAVY